MRAMNRRFNVHTKDRGDGRGGKSEWEGNNFKKIRREKK
jgi:hypothetical protein